MTQTPMTVRAGWIWIALDDAGLAGHSFTTVRDGREPRASGSADRGLNYHVVHQSLCGATITTSIQRDDSTTAIGTSRPRDARHPLFHTSSARSFPP